mmetsp:Transcript_1946/g.4484  ORF Transcript_1946/g.4484 Transcript_1946/m.4484 type:complete len:215 (-) Transcript_1946:190-834(-)|eukprot:CAMPEP_0177658560 /NCGR_PEP_ID=MMETSP0447-20121125/16882_1 /TAXON_ID=0 /ORGANISM="Stygamoeba regulata, Strain BSH-02190019" /LENGTH=214 /DNA_ID=CAMNT_0019163187 /DNA_START=107 /DNA_END=751 /DNA_ORIENTATION=-
MSKVNSEVLKESIHSIYTAQKKRNFIETIELQIGLKNYDPAKDKRFSGSLQLPHPCKANMKFCLLGTEQDCDSAKEIGLEFKSVEMMKAYKKNKKTIKKMAKSYDAFLASQTLIRQIPRLLGPTLTRMGKFPTIVNPGDDLNEKANVVRSTVKFQMKKVMCLAVAVGSMNLTEDEVLQNVYMAINFLCSLLKKNWQNIKVLYIKSSMGPSYRIY